MGDILFNYYAFYYKHGAEEPSFRNISDELTEGFVRRTKIMVNKLKCEKAIIVDSQGNVQREIYSKRGAA